MGTEGAAASGSQARTRALVDELLRSDRRAKLCAEAGRLTGASAPLVEDAFQDACELLCRGKAHGQSMGEIYNWLQRTTVRRVERKRGRAPHRRELLVASTVEDDELAEAVSPATEDEVIRREKERELFAVVSTAVAQLDERERAVVSLHSHDFRGWEIAQRLRMSDRTVKRLVKRSLADMREALVEAAGGGCEKGERLIGRFSFGLADAGERFEAQAHMSSCDECATLYRRLELVHEKIAALLPVPAAVESDLGLLERAAHKTADALAQAKEQAAESVGLAKQHATASYARAVEYSPLAAARPGTAATAIAGCLALAGGTATYCVENNLNPVARLLDTVQRDAAKPKPPPSDRARVAQRTPDPPQVPPVDEPPPAVFTPAPALESAPPASPPPAPGPPPAPAPEPTPPAVQFGEPATVTPAPSPLPEKPAPVPASGGSDLYGP